MKTHPLDLTGHQTLIEGIPVVLPTIHSNGTGREELSEAAAKLFGALSAAVRAADQFGLNGRDYYPRPGAHAAAMAEFADHCEKLRAFRTWALALEVGIHRGGHGVLPD